MVAILYVVMYDRESQMAYKELMNSPIEFKTFYVKGKNVVEMLKGIGITKVPTLVIPSKKQKLEGFLNIKAMIERVEAHLEREKKAKYISKKNKKDASENESFESEGIDIENTENESDDPTENSLENPQEEEEEEEEEQSPPKRRQPKRPEPQEDSGEEIEI